MTFAVVVLVLMALQLANVIANLRGGFPLITGRPAGAVPSISILVPARDEADHIDGCLRSLLDQGLEDVEILVLDDQSTDGTGAIVAAIAAEDERLRMLTGSAPPFGWTGKNHACSTLAARATGTWLVFVDADVVIAPGTIAEMIELAEARQYDLVSGLPASGGGLGARFLAGAMAPLMVLATPMWLLNGAASAQGGLTMGQALCVRRSAYDAVGGHAAVRGALLEDIQFAMVFAKARRRTGFVNLTRTVGADFFPTFAAAWNGLIRWFHGLASLSVAGAFTAATAGLALYLLPWVALAIGIVDAATGPVATSDLLLIAGGTLGVLSVVLVDGAMARPRWFWILQPVTLLVWFGAFSTGLARQLRGASTRWRGREVVATKAQS